MFRIHSIETEHALAGLSLEQPPKVLVTSEGAEWPGAAAGLERRYPADHEDPLRRSWEQAVYWIEQAIGYDSLASFDTAPVVHVTAPSQERLTARPLGKLLATARLLVLDGAGADFEDFAQHMVSSGGPATLLVRGSSTSRRRYFQRLYQQIGRNAPLSEAARPDAGLEAPELEVRLFLGSGGDDLFRRAVPKMGGEGTGYQESTKEEAPPGDPSEGTMTAEEPGGPTKPNGPGRKFSFDPEQGDHDQPGAGSEDNRNPPVEKPREAEDTTGPTVKGEQILEQPEPEIPRPQVSLPPAPAPHVPEPQSPEDKASPPESPPEDAPSEDGPEPRVLNANFRPANREKKLGEHEALVAGAEYDFLVDVGPRWPEGESLVTGNANFPAHSLPPVKDGWVIDVALVSESLTPRVATGQIFVPVEGGQSFPVVAGQRAGDPGPLALRVRAPAGDGRDGTFDVTARLCLYYRNNLLQSANVRARVHADVADISAKILQGLAALLPRVLAQPDETEGALLEQPNAIEVDFVLSGSWRDLAAYERRDLRLEEGAGDGLPVLASFTLNGDGSGQHRIIYKDDAELPPAFMPYDPAQAQKTLDTVRGRLLECFFLKDPNTYGLVPDGAGGWRDGLDGSNGKDRRQFKMDLAILARAGAELYEMVAGSLRPANMDALEWEERLRASTAQAGVVQVARTGPANFALPWALMYEIPLVEANPARLRFCRSVDEDWGEDGRRRAHAGQTTCRYAGDADHQRDVVCPYGFWGLKHVVEQPLGAVDPESGPDVQGASHEVVCEKEIELAVGITHELGAGGEAVRDEHLQRVAALPGVRYAKPADDWPGVQRVMEAPEVAYFLCHGMYDEQNGDVYLGVGRGNGRDQRIYSKHLMAWLRAGAGKHWRTRRPLVFVNGCHTFEVEPGHMLNLLSTFDFGRASGVIGTEVRVQLPLAVEAADLLLGSVFAGEPLGKALWKLRWTLAEKGNLLGLAYTMYALADLKVVVQKN